jgi:O-antigen/teichoic acid export membrane protein
MTDEAPPSSAPNRPASLGSSRERIGRLFKNTGIYTLGEGSLSLLGLLLWPILTAFLLPAEFGLWTLASSLLTGFMIFCNPGLHGAITRFYFDHEHDAARRQRFQGTVATFLLIWSLGLCVIATVIGPAVFAALLDEIPFWPYGVMVIWMAFLSVLGVVPKATWAAAERSASFVGVNLLGTSVFLFGSLGLVAFTGVGVLGLFYARGASLLVLGIPFVIYGLRHTRPAWSWTDLRAALAFSLPLVPHLLAHWVLSVADRFMIANHYAAREAAGIAAEFDHASGELGAAAAGLYGFAYEFMNAINLVAMSMSRAWVPQFTRAHGRPEEREFVARSITYFILVIASMSAAVAVLAPTVVRLLDPKYAFAAEIVPILPLAGLFQGLYYVYVAVLFYYKENRLVPVITIVSGIVNIALNWLWLPKLGLVGAVWATVVAYAVLLVGVRWAARRHPMPVFERRPLAKLALVLGIVAGLGIAMDGQLPLAWEIVAKLGLLGLGALALWRLGLLGRRAV